MAWTRIERSKPLNETSPRSWKTRPFPMRSSQTTFDTRLCSGCAWEQRRVASRTVDPKRSKWFSTGSPAAAPIRTLIGIPRRLDSEIWYGAQAALGEIRLAPRHSSRSVPHHVGTTEVRENLGSAALATVRAKPAGHLAPQLWQLSQARRFSPAPPRPSAGSASRRRSGIAR
jgi:hypothetical protein